MVKMELKVVTEWDRKHTLLVGWPSRGDTWRELAAPARHQMTNFMRLLLQHSNVPVKAVVDRRDQFAVSSLRSTIQTLRSLSFTEEDELQAEIQLSMLSIPMNDCWLRDISPVWVNYIGEVTKGVCFQFNAWGGENGGCYDDYKEDEKFATELCRTVHIPTIDVEFILEGGAISFDGLGTAITTEQCMLCPNRNQRVTKLSVECILRKFLGITTVIWLNYGLNDDSDTDGHVDNMAVFIQPHHVLLAWTEEGPDAHRCIAARRALEDAVDATGQRLQIHTVRLPPIIRRTIEQTESLLEGDGKPRLAGERLCASYVNIVQVDGVIFVPTFNVGEADDQACREIENAFRSAQRVGNEGVVSTKGHETNSSLNSFGVSNSDKGTGTRRNIKVVAVEASELILAGGGLHCLTQHFPITDIRDLNFDDKL